MPDKIEYAMPQHWQIKQAVKDDPVFKTYIKSKGLDLDNYYAEYLQRGVCHGITSLFLQQVSMYGVEQAAKSMNDLLSDDSPSDKSLFQQLIDLIIQFILGNDIAYQPDTAYQPKFSGLDIIGYYHRSSEHDQTDLMEDLMINTGQAYKKYTQKFNIRGSELANALENIPDNTMCHLAALNLHATAAYKENGKLYFYDSNRAAVIEMTGDEIAKYMIDHYRKDCGNEFSLTLMSKSPSPEDNLSTLQTLQMNRFNHFSTTNIAKKYQSITSTHPYNPEGEHKYLINIIDASIEILARLEVAQQKNCIAMLVQNTDRQKDGSLLKTDQIMLTAIVSLTLSNQKPKPSEELIKSISRLSTAFISYATKVDTDSQDTESMFLALSNHIKTAISLNMKNVENVLFDAKESGYDLKPINEQKDILDIYKNLNSLETSTDPTEDFALQDQPSHDLDSVVSTELKYVPVKDIIENPEQYSSDNLQTQIRMFGLGVNDRLKLATHYLKRGKFTEAKTILTTKHDASLSQAPPQLNTQQPMSIGPEQPPTEHPTAPPENLTRKRTEAPDPTPGPDKPS